MKHEGNLTSLNIATDKNSEWLCFDHDGYAKRKAEQWWVKMGGNVPTPNSVEQAILRFNECRKPDMIELKKNGKYTEIINYIFEDNQHEPTAIAIEQQPVDVLPDTRAERGANPVVRNILADIARNKACNAVL